MKKIFKGIRFHLLGGFALVVTVILVTGGFSVNAVSNASTQLGELSAAVSGSAQLEQLAAVQATWQRFPDYKMVR